MSEDAWWTKPRLIDVVVDNPSWVLPDAEHLVEAACASGDDARLVRDHVSIRAGAVAFYLGCLKITPLEILRQTRRNLVVHASDLPLGRGMSPLTWLTLAGELNIPICLFEAGQKVDEGPVIFRDRLAFAGHELIGEMRAALGRKTVDLCRRYLDAPTPPEATPQVGTPTYYRRRLPSDSRLDPALRLAEQFDLLRTVDNDSYPAFFDLRGFRYRVTIEKVGPVPETKA